MSGGLGRGQGWGVPGNILQGWRGGSQHPGGPDEPPEGGVVRRCEVPVGSGTGPARGPQRAPGMAGCRWVSGHRGGPQCPPPGMGGSPVSFPGVGVPLSLTQKSMLKKKSTYFTTGLTKEKSSPWGPRPPAARLAMAPGRAQPSRADRSSAEWCRAWPNRAEPNRAGHGVTRPHSAPPQ